MRVALYARYSTDLQNERSIEDQIASCQRLLERNGWAVGAMYADHAISAASMATRPELQRLIADMRARRIDVVVAEAIDRLSRDQADIALIHRWAELAGVKIFTLSEGEIGLLQVGLAGTMAHMFLKQLGDKTRRGMEGRVRAGRSGGGRCYGYALVPGDIGARTIVEAEAEVIRRIYEQYAVGVSPRALAFALNAEGVPGPSGRQWTQSTINGDRRVGDGVLCNELYRGVMVFGRRRFVKDPETGRRRGIVRPETDWLRKETPELRIIDDALWARVQARRASLSFDPATNAGGGMKRANRPRRLLSGLLRCGVCGGGVTIVADVRYGCSAIRSKGPAACSNRALITAAEIDARVIGGLKAHLLTPDTVAAAARAWQEETNQLQRQAARAVAKVERELAEEKRRVNRIIDMMIDADASPALKLRLKECEAKIAELERERDAYQPEEAIALHPGAADHYRLKVANLEAAIARGDLGAEVLSEVRDLIEKIVATPKADGGWDLEIHGRLASILALGAGQEKGPAGGSGGASGLQPLSAAMGAGARSGRQRQVIVRIAA